MRAQAMRLLTENLYSKQDLMMLRASDIVFPKDVQSESLFNRNLSP